jgi:hypothetical protein
LDVRAVDCDGKWMDLAQDCVQRRALILAVLKLRVFLPKC